MKRMSTLGVGALLGMVLLVSASNTVLSETTRDSRISDIVEAEVKYDLFSGTVLVAKDGQEIYSGAFGEANKETGDPINLDTRFNISSVQKTFIATVIMQLYQEGLIDLDDPLTKYYPECPWESAEQIRLRYLLNHTSGLADYRDNEEYQQNCDNYTRIDDVLPLVWRYPPAFKPGERFEYSNAGVLLLKGIIEKVTEKKLARAVEERIWEPLGMKNTTFYVGGDQLAGKAGAYTLAADGESYERVPGEPSAYAGGGIYTTVGDLLKFDQALYTDRLLTEENRNLMFTPVEASPNYAYGWIVVDFGGTTVIYHSGGSGGFNSEFRRYPEKGYTVIVLSNYQGAAFDLANKIDCMLLDLPYEIATEEDLHFKRGMHFQDHELYTRALESFEKNTIGDRPHMPSLYQAARTRILGEFGQEKAIDLLDRYISLADESTRPSIAAAWWRKGVAYEQMGEIEEATACHKKCLELDDGFADAQAALERLLESK
ncbi:MAG: serine hydrolase [Candidatus Zixiibacteriota bacterium]|nr:MAG: serine hydrolase [candidate division Zixibacteria bacterium]